MSIASIITDGIGPGGSIPYVITLGYSQGSAPTPSGAGPTVLGIARLRVVEGPLRDRVVDGVKRIRVVGI